MARNVDLNEAIRAIVAEEVGAALAPHTEALVRLQNFLGIKGGALRSVAAAPGPRRGPGRARRAASGGGAGDASKFSEGQTVRYKQGRGEFEAKVIAIDTENNVLTLQRTTDNKKVERPAGKVY